MWITLYFTSRSKSISESFILSMSNSLSLSPHSALCTSELNKYLLASPMIPNAGGWLQSPQPFVAPLCLWRVGTCCPFQRVILLCLLLQQPRLAVLGNVKLVRLRSFTCSSSEFFLRKMKSKFTWLFMA